MLLSKKISNALFGKVNMSDDSLNLNIEEMLYHPDGRLLKWPSSDGVLLTLHKRISELEEKLNNKHNK